MAENMVVQSIVSENVVVKSTTAEKRKRGQNFTAEDKDLLVKLLVNYKDIILNKKTDSATNEAKQKAWSDVTNAFNAIATVHRTKDSLLKLWENMKQRVEYYQTKGTTVCPIDTMEQVRELLGRASTGMKEELNQDSEATSYNGESSEVGEMIIPEISFSTQEVGAALEMSNDEQMPKIPKLEKPEQAASPKVPMLSRRRPQINKVFSRRRPQFSNTNERAENINSLCTSFSNVNRKKEDIEDLKKQLLEEEIEFKRKLYELHLQAAAKEVDIKNEILIQIRGGNINMANLCGVQR